MTGGTHRRGRGRQISRFVTGTVIVLAIVALYLFVLSRGAIL
jgi:hypothetical protein